MHLTAFWDHVARGAPEECWPWTGWRTPQGYGALWIPGHRSRAVASRIAAMLTWGELPARSQVNHLCHNPPCCNPAHLQVGTQRDNMRQMVHAGRVRPWKATWTHCQRGHALTPENVRINTRGNRQCATCYHATASQARGQRRAGAPAPERTKLTAAQRQAICARYAQDRPTQRVLAAEFGVSRPTISRVITQHSAKLYQRASRVDTVTGPRGHRLRDQA